METIKTFERVLEPGWLEKIRSSGGGLTERELVDRSIKFANSGSIKSYFNFTAQLERAHQEDKRDPSPPAGIKATQERLRDALTAIVDGQVTLERVQTWRLIADGLLPIESTSDSREFHYLEVVSFASPEPAGLFALVLLWLQDTHRPYRGDLCQCRWHECEKFFFAVRPETGRPQRFYCPESDHMTKAHDAAAADRVRRSRAERKKRASIKTKRRK
jgi:hypothetical protein